MGASCCKAAQVVAAAAALGGAPLGAWAFDTPFGYCTLQSFQALVFGSLEVIAHSGGKALQAEAAKGLLENPALLPDGRLAGCGPATALHHFMRAAYLGDGSGLAAALDWLARLWWSELLLMPWASVVLEAARAALLSPAARSAGRVAAAAAATAGPAAEVVWSLAATLRGVRNATGTLRGFVSAADGAQRRFLRLAATTAAAAAAAPRLPPPVAPLLGALSVLDELNRPRVWWAGESRLWISMHCGDIATFVSNCLPLLQEALQTPLLSRHSYFVAAGDQASRDTLRKWADDLPIVLEVFPDAAVDDIKRVGYDVAALATHRKVMDRALEERRASSSTGRPYPELVLALDMIGATNDGDSALPHLWGLDRWLLHGEVDPPSNAASPLTWVGPARRFDALWAYEDGCSEGLTVLQCNGDGSVVPRASTMLVRVKQAGSTFLTLLFNEAVELSKLPRNASRGGVRMVDFNGVASAALASLLAAGDPERLRGAAGPGRLGAWWRERPQVGDLGQRGIRVRALPASTWRSTSSPSNLVLGRPPGLGRRGPNAKAAVVCDRHSTGGSSKVSGTEPVGKAYVMGNCVAMPRILDGGGNVFIPVKPSTERWFCPRLVPVAVHALLRAGSHSVVNWAASIDGLSAWMLSMDSYKDALKMRQTWTPLAYKPPCCARGAGRLLLAVVRSPFDRLRSYFTRRETPANARLPFPAWCRWALGRIRAGDWGAQGAGAATSRGSAKEVWTESDALHLAPLSRNLATATPPVLLSRFTLAAAAGRPGGAAAAGPPPRLLLVLRLERMPGDAEAAEAVLRERFGYAGPPLPQFPWSHSSSHNERYRDCCPWEPDVVQLAAEVYREEIRLGGYPPVPGTGPPDGPPQLLEGPPWD